MPNKPLKPCSKQGCVNLTRGRYCEIHKHVQQDMVRDYDRNRDPQSKSFYKSRQWQMIREVVKTRDNGLCVECLRNGRIRQGKIVDHIEPLKLAWEKRLLLTNLQYLCQKCHNAKTQKDIQKCRRM
jgi:5-methylcytosine-specific restriction protein A